MPDIVELLNQAVALQNQGRNRQAEAVYRQVLQQAPDQPDALHLLGLALSAEGQHAEAVERLERAAALIPGNAMVLSNLGVVYRRAGKLDRAVDAYRESIRLDPEYGDAFANLGKVLRMLDQHEAAIEAFSKAIQLNQRAVSAWLGWMNTLSAQSDYGGALEIGRRGLTQNPGKADLLVNCGIMAKRLRRMEECQEYFREALARDPDHLEALCRLTKVLIAQRNMTEAAGYLERARSLAADDLNVLIAEGLFFKETGDLETALRCYERALIIDPESADVHASLGTVQNRQGDLSAARASFEQALRRSPIGQGAAVNLAATLLNLGQIDEAERLLRESLDEDLVFVEARDNLLMCLQYQPACSLEDLKAEHLLWGKLHADNLVQPLDTRLELTGDGQIQVGLVSADLGNHPVGYFVHGLLRHLDRDRFQVSVYSDRLSGDPLEAELRSLADRWHDNVGLSDEALFRQIRTDKIDILFDLAGHTAHNRLLTFARRAAPLQITWAGYVGTTGLSQMDYLLADRFHVPEELSHGYVEKVVRMPDGYISYTAPNYLPEVNPSPVESTGHLTLAVVANPPKVNRQTLRVWEEILERLPQARLVFCYKGWPDPANRERVLSELGRFEERIRFEFKQGHQAMLEYYHELDLALDTFPYSGGLTTCEALMMGLPTVTLPGEKFCSRHALSHLSNVGLYELIAVDEADYVNKVVELASDIPRLAGYRRTLRERTELSPLCDAESFASALGNILEDLWLDWCASHSTSIHSGHE